MRSWKTTLGGILVAVGVSLQDQLEPDWLPGLAKILIGVGSVLLGTFARDNNISSEKAGAK